MLMYVCKLISTCIHILTYASVARAYERATIACHVRTRTYVRKSGPTLSSTTVFTHRAYIRIYPILQLRYNHVIIVSYIKCCCVLMWYYVFAIKFKYYERKKVRHITIPLHCFNGSHICFIIIIQYFQKVPFYHILYRIKKRDLKKISVSSLIACITCVLYVSPLILFSFN